MFDKKYPFVIKNLARVIYKMRKLPYELIDMILLKLDSLEISLQLFRLYTAKHIYNPYLHTMALASYNGDLYSVRYIDRVGVYNTPIYIDYASMNGHIDIVRYLYSMEYSYSLYTAMNHASIHGHLNVVHYLDSIGASCGIMAMNLATANGHLEVVKFLNDSNHTKCKESALIQAKIRNNCNAIEILTEPYTINYYHRLMSVICLYISIFICVLLTVITLICIIIKTIN